MRRKQAVAPRQTEVLESRNLLSSVSIVDSVLTVQGDAADNEVVVTEDVEAGTVSVQLDGNKSVFERDEVSALVIRGRRGDDLLENRSSLNASIFGGEGNDVMRGGSGDDLLRGGRGDDVINDFGGNNILKGNDGDDTLQSVSSGADVFRGGKGRDLLYAIVGEANTVVSGEGPDQIIVREDVDAHDGQDDDTVVAFRFDEPPVTLRDGVLYVMGGGTAYINQIGEDLFVIANGEVARFKTTDVAAIAGIGSADGDVFANFSDIPSVYYGANGNDVLIGGSSNDLLKGGNGNDLIIGRSGADDMSGDAGADFLIGGIGNDKIRFDDLDAVFRDANDLLIRA